MSWRAISNDEFDKIIPVIPPSENKKIKPRTHNNAGVSWSRAPYSVASQLNTLIPVGTAIIMVADVKYARVSVSMPTVNIWCAHTIKPSPPIEAIA